MTWAEVLIHAVVLLVGFPAATRNATAAALCLSWMFGQGVWYVTGDSLPLHAYLIADFTVIAVIYAKAPAFDCYPYTSRWHQLACFWLERSYEDRIILSLFAAMFACYTLPLSDYHKWWALFWLCIAQFLVAGVEAVRSYLSARAANAGNVQPVNPSSGLEYRWWWGLRTYG